MERTDVNNVHDHAALHVDRQLGDAKRFLTNLEHVLKNPQKVMVEWSLTRTVIMICDHLESKCYDWLHNTLFNIRLVRESSSKGVERRLSNDHVRNRPEIQ